MFGYKLINPDKLTSEELIKLLNFENMSVEKLTDLKIKIIEEMKKRTNHSLQLSEEYKSFALFDYSPGQEHIMEIKFIIDPDNSLFGIDEKINFYAGKVTVGVYPGLFLLKFSKNPNIVYCSKYGRLSDDYKRYYGNCWEYIHHNKIAKQLNQINNLNRQDNSDLVTLYDKIIDEKIDNIDTLISNSYLCMLPNFEYLEDIVNVVNDKYHKIYFKKQ